MNQDAKPIPAIPHLPPPQIAYVNYCGIIDSAGVTRIGQNLTVAVNQGYNEVYLCFSSPGGHTSEGIYLYNLIMGLPIPITIHNTGIVASAATTIFAAGTRRLCSANSIFMIHPVSMGGQSMVSAAIQSTLDFAQLEEERIDNVLRTRTSIPDEVLQRRRAGEVYMTPADAVQHGLATEVAEFSLPPGQQIFQI